MLIDAFRALQAGKELARAETWKRAQVWTGHLTVLLGAGASIAASLGYPVNLTPEQITTLVSAVAIVVGLFNSYATVATTSRIGLPAGGEDDPPGISDRGGHRTVHNGFGQWITELDDRGVPELRDVDRSGGA